MRYLGEKNVAEINLNCGCPSPLVAGKNCFGARLMLDPERVRRIVDAMIRVAPNTLISVKHRLGTDLGGAEYEDTLKFVRAAYAAAAPERDSIAF